MCAYNNTYIFLKYQLNQCLAFNFKTFFLNGFEMFEYLLVYIFKVFSIISIDVDGSKCFDCMNLLFDLHLGNSGETSVE